MLTSFDELLQLTSTRLQSPFRPGRADAFDVRSARDPQCRAAVLAALSEHSDLAGQFHVLSRDAWRFLWSPCGRAFIPFHERGFALIAWRDPVGPQDARVAALRSFHAYARRRGKHAVILGVSEALIKASTELGFGATWVGAEPFFDLATWSTRGKSGEKLRLAMNHARRLGAEARELFPLEVPVDRERLCQVEAEWKAARPVRRNTSFLRTDPLENAAHRRYFAVETFEGGKPRLQSFLVCSPVSANGYYLQDLVRHPMAPRGATELVSVAAMEALKRAGLRFVTMGIVPFWDPTGTRPPPSVAGAGRWVVQYCDKLYRFSGLQQFRAKFSPTRVVSQYVLHWPRILTPLAAWNLVSVLSPASLGFH